MKQQIYITIGLLILTNTILISCGKTAKKTYKFNGIYKTQQDGKEFSLIGNKEKTIKIDTIPIIIPEDFDKVRTEFYAATNEPLLSILLTETGKVKFAELTRLNIGKPLAIILNDQLLSMPIVEMEIPNGNIVISGLDKNLIEKLVEEFSK